MATRRSFLTALMAAALAPGDDKSSGVSLQIILVKTRPQAEEVLKRLKAGEPFETLAEQFSIVPSGKWGGHIGELELSTLPPSVQSAVKGIGPGQVTGIIETSSGYLIVKVVSGAEVVKSPTPTRVGMGGEGVAANYDRVTDVCGLPEAEGFFERFAKPSTYQQDLQTNCSCRLQSTFGGIQQIEKYLSFVARPDASGRDLNREMQAHETVSQLLSYVGNMEKATAHFQAAHDIAIQLGSKEQELTLAKKLAIAHFHGAEMKNWVNNHNPECAIFPFSSKGQFTLTTGAENAIEYLRKCLDYNPDDLEGKWLINLTYMSLGKYPDSVPKSHLLESSMFESKENIGRFEDVAPRLGLDFYCQSGGVVVDDFDNDGFLDIMVSSWDPCVNLRYFHNNGDGTFSDRTAQAGLSNQLGGLNLIQTDYNNDGWVDLYVPRGAWSTPVRSSLLRNNGNGTFTDVTYEAGLGIPATSTQAVVWADFDNDGFVDLFVGNEHAPAQLFHNNGNGTFTDVAHFAGVDRIAFSKAVVAGDYDNDGFPDVYVSNYGEENFLYHNNGDGTFTEVGRRLGVERPVFSFPAWFFDYDNDGWLDIFASSFIHSVSEIVRSYCGLPIKAETLKLYKNMGGASFRDVTKEVGLDRVFMPMGANFGDVDNDGFLDFYLGTGDPSYASLVPNVLFKNINGKYFVDITTSSGTGSLRKGHGVAFADIFNNGQPCIFENIGGSTPGDKYFCSLFRNPGTGNNWISIKLVGVKTNRAAFGARIKLTLAGAGGETQFIYRDVNSGGSFGGSPLQQHIGLGKATRIETLEIWWPTSKTRQVFHNLYANQFIEVHEFAKDFVRLERQSIKL